MPPPSRPVVSTRSGQNDHVSEIISNLLEPVVKTWKGGMEVESTGDMVSIVNDINEQNIELEDVDLEMVDRELENQEKAADDRYNNFDTEQLVQKETECPDTLDIPCTVEEPVKIQKSAKLDMAALTSELIEEMSVR